MNYAIIALIANLTVLIGACLTVTLNNWLYLTAASVCAVVYALFVIIFDCEEG